MPPPPHPVSVCKQVKATALVPFPRCRVPPKSCHNVVATTSVCFPCWVICVRVRLLSPLLDFRPLYVWFILLPLTVCAGVGHYGSHQKCVWTARLSHRKGLRRRRISDSCVVGLCFSNCSKGELMFLLMILTTCLKFVLVFAEFDHRTYPRPVWLTRL